MGYVVCQDLYDEPDSPLDYCFFASGTDELDPRPCAARTELGPYVPGHCVVEGDVTSEAWVYYLDDPELNDSISPEQAERFCWDGEGGVWVPPV